MKNENKKIEKEMKNENKKIENEMKNENEKIENELMRRLLIGTRIMRRREELYLDLDTAAELLELPVDEYKNYEYGQTEIYPDMLLKLAQVFQTSPNYFFQDLYHFQK